MYKYILESAGNINWMALFALFTFMFVFLVGAWVAFVKDKDEIKRIAAIPLENDDL
jgi:hypothetical protein